MSDQYPPGGQGPGDFASEPDPTRVEIPVPAYDRDPGYDRPQGAGPTGEPPKPGIVAPLVTVALLAIILGLALGYLFFHDSSSGKSPATTTSTSTSSTTSTSTTASTLYKATTTTTIRKATTTTGLSTSTSTKATTTTKPTTSTTKATTTTTG